MEDLKRRLLKMVSNCSKPKVSGSCSKVFSFSANWK